MCKAELLISEHKAQSLRRVTRLPFPKLKTAEQNYRSIFHRETEMMFLSDLSYSLTLASLATGCFFWNFVLVGHFSAVPLLTAADGGVVPTPIPE